MHIFRKSLFFPALACLLSACVTTNNTNPDNKPWKPEFRIQAGINHGGIVENTDMSVVPGAEVDAFSGATKIGFNAGAHILLPVKRNSIETGIDYMLSNQEFYYGRNQNQLGNIRCIRLTQLMLPLAYNFGVIKKKQPVGIFQVKPGFVFQYNFFNIQDLTDPMPPYTTDNFSWGFSLGFASTPIKFQNGTGVGLYLDLYRGSKIYEDYYNQSTFEIKGTSYVKFGIIYHLGSF